MKTVLPAILALLTQACVGSPETPLRSLEVTTDRGHFFVEFVDLVRERDGEAPARICVSVIKDDPVAGWVEWSHVHREGDRLGWNHDSGERTSVHRVFSSKVLRHVMVDFDTGWTIKEIILERPGDTIVRECAMPVWPQSPVCPGPKDTRALENAVLLKDESGRLKLHTESLPLLTAERLCRHHGGTRAPSRWTEQQARYQREADEQRQLSKNGKLKENRARKAAYLLWYADDDWHSKNPKVRARSRDTYRELLKVFSSEAVVSENHDRIKARAEAEIEE